MQGLETQHTLGCSIPQILLMHRYSQGLPFAMHSKNLSFFVKSTYFFNRSATSINEPGSTGVLHMNVLSQGLNRIVWHQLCNAWHI